MPTPTPEGTDLIAELKQAVTDSGLSLSELAKRSGVNHSQLSRFMRGERLLALDSAAKLFTSLGLRVVKPAPPKGRGKK